MKSKFIPAFSVMALFFAMSFTANAVEVGDTAPCVVLEGVDGTGAATEGCIRDVVDDSHTHTLIEFFSIKCSTCEKNLPRVSALAADLSDSLTVRLVSVDRKVEDVKAFLGENPAKDLISFPVAFDNERTAMKAYKAFGIPVAIVLDRNNKVVYRHSGEILEEDIAAIKEVVAGGGSEPGLKVGEVAPCVVLEGVDTAGETWEGCIRDQEKEGQTHTLIEFFSITCNTCQKNVPGGFHLASALGDKLTVRYVIVDRDQEAVASYLAHPLAKNLINHPIAFDNDRIAFQAYTVAKAPTTFLLDSNNVVKFRHKGALLKKHIEQIKSIVNSVE